MRTGKPGKWWLLAQTSPVSNAPISLYWTGTWFEDPLGPQPRMPVFTTSLNLALQFDCRASAIFAQSMFGLDASLRPVEREFVTS